MSKRTEKVATKILDLWPAEDMVTVKEIAAVIDREGFYLGEGDWVQLEDGTRRICGARYQWLTRCEVVCQMVADLSANVRWSLDYALNYGIDHRRGWSLCIDGHTVIQFADRAETALEAGIKFISDAAESGKRKHVSVDPPETTQ